MTRWRNARRARQAVIRENYAASSNPTLDPMDPRWVLAVRVQSQLQGSMLTPERRERIMGVAKLLGIQLFDANLIVAIVQDHARRGLHLSEAQGTLSIIRKPEPRSLRKGWLRWGMAFLIAAVANTLLIWWLLRA